MFTVKKRMEIAGAHKLDLPYDSACKRLHGHNWIIEVEISAEELNSNGMVVDFALIKKIVKDKMDHQNLNEVFNFNPTAENIAKRIADMINLESTGWVSKITVQESEGNVVCYTP